MNENTLCICDAEGPVALAGVMGGLNSEIRDTTKAVLFLLRQKRGYLFEPARLGRELAIDAKELEAVTRDLETLEMVSRAEVCINGEERKLYYYQQREHILPLFLLAKYVGYNACFHYQSDDRDEPLIRP